MEQKQKTTTNKHTFNTFTIICVAAALIISAAIIGTSVFFDFNNKPEIPNQGGVKIENNVVDLSNDNITPSDAPKSISVPGYPDVQINSDETHIPLYLLNPEGNPCYFSFEIYLDDYTNLLYSTDLILPGKALEGFDIDHNLSQGEHKLIMKINTYSLKDGQTPLNGANVESKLIVK